MSEETPTTYWERRRAGEFERVAAERAAVANAALMTEPPPTPPGPADHIPLGSWDELYATIMEWREQLGPPTGGGGIRGEYYYVSSLSSDTGVWKKFPLTKPYYHAASAMLDLSNPISPKALADGLYSVYVNTYSQNDVGLPNATKLYTLGFTLGAAWLMSSDAEMRQAWRSASFTTPPYFLAAGDSLETMVKHETGLTGIVWTTEIYITYQPGSLAEGAAPMLATTEQEPPPAHPTHERPS